jgi:hypothetical protein
MDLPLNTDVVDYRIDRRIGFWDGEKLVDNPVRVSAQERQEVEKRLQERQQYSKITRYVVLIVSGLLIILGVVMIIRNWLQRKQ